MTILKKDYIDKLEPAWDKLRKKYGIPDGFCLHFTDIKALLNPKSRKSKKVKESVLGKVFLNDGKVNFELIKSFYIDVLKIIEDNDFKIVVTGKRFTMRPIYQKLIEENYYYHYWYTLFSLHLDNLAFYMQELSNDYSIQAHKKKARKDKKAKMKYKILTTKLRYDGDYGLSSRKDLRDAYSHVITTGTQNFTSNFTTRCFDSLKFIDKLEVGNYKTCSTCNTPQISHAGNELVDFIAFFASNALCESSKINDLQIQYSYTKEEAEQYAKKSLVISIKNEVIEPLKSIKDKIFIPFD